MTQIYIVLELGTFITYANQFSTMDWTEKRVQNISVAAITKYKNKSCYITDYAIFQVLKSPKWQAKPSEGFTNQTITSNFVINFARKDSNMNAHVAIGARFVICKPENYWIILDRREYKG